jgi:ABC-type arginine transport system permease subunit
LALPSQSKKKKSDGDALLQSLSSSSLLQSLLLSLFFALAKTLPLKVFSNLARAERCRRRCSPEGVLLLLQAWASRRRRRRRRQHKQSIVLSTRDEPRARFTGTICAALCMNE